MGVAASRKGLPCRQVGAEAQRLTPSLPLSQERGGRGVSPFHPGPEVHRDIRISSQVLVHSVSSSVPPLLILLRFPTLSTKRISNLHKVIMKKNSLNPLPPATLMVWTLTDEVIENKEKLESQFQDIHQSGFGGVAAYVRCSRYSWNDPPARAAFRMVSRLCRQHNMACWLGPDPRFVSRQLIGSHGGMEVLLFGDRPRAEHFPNLAIPSYGKFNVRCSLEPRHVHTLNEVAIEYYPRGIARAFAFHESPDAQIPDKVIDISKRVQFFYNARFRYVEAFGSIPELNQEGWRVLVFFRAKTSHVDYSNRQHILRYHSMLGTLKREGVAADGIMWDEPGYTCTYGTLPCTGQVLREYRSHTGKNLLDELWKLVLPAGNDSHVRVRCSYYEAVQTTLNAANAATTNHVHRLWGTNTQSGIHDTWHFESADMCDMNHGSLDLWKAMKTKTGGFVDLGGIDQLRQPDDPWYSHLAAMNVICASLGKMSKRGFAYNNLWTVGDDDGEGWQATIMNQCVDTMALFGLRWMAHAYGPVGTIGEERSFLGSPELPGYPLHSTWPHFPEWNRRLSSHLEVVKDRLPESHVLVVFPVESLYALAGPAADTIAREVFRLILTLVDQRFQVDVHSLSLCRDGRWERNEFVLGDSRYNAVILPFLHILPAEDLAFVRQGSKNVFFIGGPPTRLTNGHACTLKRAQSGNSIDSALDWLNSLPGAHPLTAPERSWATITQLRDGAIVSLCPSRHGYSFSGRVAYKGLSVTLPEHSGLTRVFFPHEGEPEIDLPQKVQ
jgi:hypothetical protein